MLFDERQVLWVAAACYLAGLVLGTVSLIREKRHSRVTMFSIIAIGYLLQTLGLVMRGQEVHGCPLGNIFEIVQFASWSTTSLYLLIGATFRLSMLGYLSSSLAAALSLTSLAVPSWDSARNSALSGGNPFVAMHAGLAMFAYGVFALLALTSLLFLLRDHSLQSKRLGGWFSFLPSLVQLDMIGYRLQGVGVGLLSIAMGVGYMYWRLDEATVDRTKLLAVGVLWIAYIISLVLRVSGRLVGRRFAWVCLLLYVAALLTLWPIDRSRHPGTEPAASRTQATP
jgi:ABC-type uncharacterized transport system permease subunit